MVRAHPYQQKNKGGHNEQAGRNVTNQDREERKKLIGTRQERRRKKHSDNFNKMFKFFLQSYRKGILTFCGENVEVIFDVNGDDGKITFKKFDNGEFKYSTITSQHPNITKGVIVGKKSWGLWINQWSDGISEGTFTKREILEEFEKRNIEIPESLMNDFENKIYKKILDRIKNTRV